MKKKSYFSCLTVLGVLLALYFSAYLNRILPFEKRTIPYAASHPIPYKRYAHYTITDESSHLELMRVPLLVHIGDEVLAADNKLYRVVRIEDDHAYAKFIRRIKL